MDLRQDPCPICGHARPSAPCPNCRGALRELSHDRPLPVGRGGAADAVRGCREVPRALFALLHDRPFVGRLWLPACANAAAFTLLVLLGVLVLLPAFAAAFAAPWWLADGVRTHHRADGPALWLFASWLVLGMPLLEALAGALHEGLRDRAEQTMLGVAAIRPNPRGALLRLRDRARQCAAALLLWPVALGLVLVPWAGPPLVVLLGAAVAAVTWFELPMAGRGLGPRARLRLLWRNRWRALGVGLGLQGATAVPFVNLLALSAVATVAATSAFLQFDKLDREAS